MKKEDKIILSMLLGALIGLLIACCIERKAMVKYEAADTIADTVIYPLHSKIKP